MTDKGKELLTTHEGAMNRMILPQAVCPSAPATCTKPPANADRIRRRKIQARVSLAPHYSLRRLRPTVCNANASTKNYLLSRHPTSNYCRSKLHSSQPVIKAQLFISLNSFKSFDHFICNIVFTSSACIKAMSLAASIVLALIRVFPSVSYLTCTLLLSTTGSGSLCRTM